MSMYTKLQEKMKAALMLQ